jgi:hypothetical protein
MATLEVVALHREEHQLRVAVVLDERATFRNTFQRLFDASAVSKDDDRSLSMHGPIASGLRGLRKPVGGLRELVESFDALDAATRSLREHDVRDMLRVSVRDADEWQDELQFNKRVSDHLPASSTALAGGQEVCANSVSNAVSTRSTLDVRLSPRSVKLLRPVYAPTLAEQEERAFSHSRSVHATTTNDTGGGDEVEAECASQHLDREERVRVARLNRERRKHSHDDAQAQRRVRKDWESIEDVEADARRGLIAREMADGLGRVRQLAIESHEQMHRRHIETMVFNFHVFAVWYGGLAELHQLADFERTTMTLGQIGKDEAVQRAHLIMEERAIRLTIVAACRAGPPEEETLARAQQNAVDDSIDGARFARRLRAEREIAAAMLRATTDVQKENARAQRAAVETRRRTNQAMRTIGEHYEPRGRSTIEADERASYPYACVEHFLATSQSLHREHLDAGSMIIVHEYLSDFLMGYFALTVVESLNQVAVLLEAEDAAQAESLRQRVQAQLDAETQRRCRQHDEQARALTVQQRRVAAEMDRLDALHVRTVTANGSKDSTSQALNTVELRAPAQLDAASSQLSCARERLVTARQRLSPGGVGGLDEDLFGV